MSVVFRSGVRPALVATLLCLVAAAQSPLERAATLAREKRYAESSKALEGVPEPAPINQRIAFHRLKAANASGLGDHASAVVEMLQALKLAPADQGLLVGTAMAEFQAGQLDAAIAHASQAGDNPTAKAVLGDIDEKRGHFLEAANAYRDAVRLSPAKEEYRVSFAYDLLQHQDFRSAAELLEQSAPLFPQSARIRTLLGIALYLEGELERARASFLDAIVVDPKMESAYRCLAKIVLQTAAAPPVAVIDRLCNWDATVCSAMRLRVARENHDLKMQEAAVAGLQRAAADDPVARCELARAWDWTNRLAEARVEMEACVRSDPSPQNHYRMGLIYKRLGFEELSENEMRERNRLLQQMSEETAAGLNALNAFR